MTCRLCLNDVPDICEKCERAYNRILNMSLVLTNPPLSVVANKKGKGKGV